MLPRHSEGKTLGGTNSGNGNLTNKARERKVKKGKEEERQDLIL
jgi:hypothetical protein